MCMYVEAICNSENTRRFSTGGSSPQKASADFLRYFHKLLALFRHRMMPGRWSLKSYILIFNKYRPMPVQCV